MSDYHVDVIHGWQKEGATQRQMASAISGNSSFLAQFQLPRASHENIASLSLVFILEVLCNLSVQEYFHHASAQHSTDRHTPPAARSLPYTTHYTLHTREDQTIDQPSSISSRVSSASLSPALVQPLTR